MNCSPRTTELEKAKSCPLNKSGSPEQPEYICNGLPRDLVGESGRGSQIYEYLEEKTEPGVEVHTCKPSTWEAETEGLQVPGQPQQLGEALCSLMRPCFKIKKIKQGWGVAQR